MECYKCAQGAHNRCYGTLLGVPEHEEEPCDCYHRVGKVFITYGCDKPQETVSIRDVDKVPPKVRELLIDSDWLFAVTTETVLDGTVIYRKVDKDGHLLTLKRWKESHAKVQKG